MSFDSPSAVPPQADLAAASAYVVAHGDALQRARTLALTENQPVAPPPDWLALQQADGGWPLGGSAGRPSSLHATAHALLALLDLRHETLAAAEQARAFIKQRQTKRGVWRESPDLMPFDPPLWQVYDNNAADVYTTALCSSILVPWDVDLLAVDRGVGWLQSQQGMDGLLAGFRLPASWLALPALAQVLNADARAVRRVVAALGDGLSRDWSGAMLAECLRSFAAAGYSPHTTKVVSRALEQLHRDQQPDGSFSAEDEADVAEATVQAIAVLTHRQMRM